MPVEMGPSPEMYLKSLFELAVDGEPVPISALAGRLGHNAVSSTEMIHRLERMGLVSHHPYRGVSLTPQGADHARALVRRHRLWERFLFDELGMAWEEVHPLACQLEHAVGDEVTDALDHRLGRPAECPHGNPIPRGSSPSNGQETLLDQSPGDCVELAAVHPETQDVLAYLQRQGIRPGIALQIEVVDRERRTAVVRTATGWVALPGDVAARLRVRLSGGRS
jgi:DtxR family Mn-dependent transcriptional regulator